MAKIEFQGISDSFNVTGEVTTLTYGSYVPTAIIDATKDWQIVVKWKTTGANCSIITGSWEVRASFETMGPELPEFHEKVDLRPGSSPIEYDVDFRILANSVHPGVYRLVVTIIHLDSTGKGSSIAGYCDLLMLQLYQGDVSPSEFPEPTMVLRAEKIKLLTALEYSQSTWHTIDDISRETGLPSEKIKELIKILGEHVMKEMVPNVTGTDRYATKARIQRELRSKERDLDVRTAAQYAISAGESVASDSNKAYERIVGSTTSVLTQLEMNYNQARAQANGQYRLSLIAGGVGIILIVVAAATLLLEHTSTAIVTTLSSIVFGTMAAFFFRESRKANQRVDNISTKLNDTREILVLVGVADTTTDRAKRDELKIEIVKNVLSHKVNAG